MNPPPETGPDAGETTAFSLDPFPHARALGMKLEILPDGRVRLSIPYAEKLIGDPATGVIHGGVVTTLLDTGCGVAAGHRLSGEKAVATLDLRIDYMRPATPGRTIMGLCECYRMTRSVAFCRGAAYDTETETDDPVATVAGAFIITPYGAWK